MSVSKAIDRIEQDYRDLLAENAALRAANIHMTEQCRMVRHDIAEARNKALEEAAIAAETDERIGMDWPSRQLWLATKCDVADAIRALKDKAP